MQISDRKPQLRPRFAPHNMRYEVPLPSEPSLSSSASFFLWSSETWASTYTKLQERFHCIQYLTLLSLPIWKFPGRYADDPSASLDILYRHFAACSLRGPSLSYKVRPSRISSEAVRELFQAQLRLSLCAISWPRACCPANWHNHSAAYLDGAVGNVKLALSHHGNHR